MPFYLPWGTSLAGTSGLIFPSNGAAGSDIRLVWDGANLLPRTAHTAIWLANYVQQSGYYAVTWHSPNNGSWDNGEYSFGAHPYPCDGTTDQFGRAAVPGGSGGAVHYQEIAGLPGANDFIATPTPPGPQDIFLVAKGAWYMSARSVEVVSGTTLRHKYWPDVGSNPTKFIQADIALSALGSAGLSPAFYLGASDWRSGQGGAGRNDETPSATLRGLRLFNAGLAIADIQTEVAAIGSNAAASSAGQASVWYINDNPTPTDVADKSGAGHNPSWANANRPTLFTG